LPTLIGTDTDRSATYDFLFVFYSNYGPILLLYRLRDNRRCLQHFPILVYLTPPLRGSL